MGKKIIACIWILLVFFTKSMYANERLKNENIHLASNGLIFYVELEYELDNNVYVSDELAIESAYSFKMENRVLKVNYFPRSSKIQIANESTHYPSLVRLIQNGNSCGLEHRELEELAELLK